MANNTNPASGTAGDDDVVQFDLTNDTDDTPNLRVNLNQEETAEEDTGISFEPPKTNELETPAMSSSSGSFSLGGDDLMDLLERLVQKMKDRKMEHEQTLRQLNDSIVKAKESIRREEATYAAEQQKMMQVLDTVRGQITGPASAPSKTVKK
jgi:hypothetical protein